MPAPSPGTATARPPWMGQARCAETDPAVFFPEDSINATAAKRICRTCEVRAACLAWAIATGEQWGVWGGLTGPERRRERLRTAPRGTAEIIADTDRHRDRIRERRAAAAHRRGGKTAPLPDAA